MYFQGHTTNETMVYISRAPLFSHTMVTNKRLTRAKRGNHLSDITKVPQQTASLHLQIKSSVLTLPL